MRRRAHRAVFSQQSRTISVRQMQRLDEAAIQTVGIPRLLLMDHAGWAVAQATMSLLARRRAASHRQSPGQVVAWCGMGFNGGDGLCAAWHVARHGHRVAVELAGSVGRLREESAIYARILRAFAIPIHEVTSADQVGLARRRSVSADVLIDALLGVGLKGPVRPLEAALIDVLDRLGKPIVAVDVPSGLDADDGRPQETAVHATVTVTFGRPKRGFVTGQGPRYVGRLIVDDLGMPPAILRSP